MWARYCTIECLEKPGSLIRIWAINRLRAKQLLWQEFIDVAARHKVRIKTHETELTIRFENGSEIRLLGADKDKEAQKKRGDKTRMEVILESQLFGPFLKTLVEDVAEPCLFDHQGTMCMEGTPALYPRGTGTTSPEETRARPARGRAKACSSPRARRPTRARTRKNSSARGGACIAGACSTTRTCPMPRQSWRTSARSEAGASTRPRSSASTAGSG